MEHSKLENKIKQYHIAYFDILGYKSVFEDQESDIIEFLQGVINVCIETQLKALDHTRLLNEEFIVKSFSDNFMILVETPSGLSDYNIVKFLVSILAQLQVRFLEKHSILIRGGITKGEAYIDNNIVFGKGLIRAVELEDKYSVFPRIIIDDNCFDQFTLNELLGSNNVALDKDGQYYIDYLRKLIVENPFSVRARKNLISLIKKYGKYNALVKDEKKIAVAEKTISKYAWVLVRYNECCDKYGGNKIAYLLRINDRILKAEIIVV